MGLVSNAAKGGSGSGGLTSIFASTLAAPAASIDTGSLSTVFTGTGLLIVIVARIVNGTSFGQVNVTLNNDATAVYDLAQTFGTNGVTTSSATAAQNAWLLPVSGDSNTYFGTQEIRIPNASTGLLKAATAIGARNDPSTANSSDQFYALGYRGTSAVSRVKVTGVTNNMMVGSSLRVYSIA